MQVAFSIALNSGAIGIQGEGNPFHVTHLAAERTAEQLALSLRDLLDKNAPPSAIFTPSGPGRFTTLRVQLATAYGLSAGYGCSLITPSLFDIVTHAMQKDPVIIAIQSGRGDYFCRVQGKDVVQDASHLTHRGSFLASDDPTLMPDLLLTPAWIVEKLLCYADHWAPNALDSNSPYYVKTPTFKTLKDRC